MAYNVYKHPPRSDFERQLREWNDSQPLNPSTYEDGTRITSGAGQVEIWRDGKCSVIGDGEDGALGFADVLELNGKQQQADDIRARVAEMRRLREEAEIAKLKEIATMTNEELLEVADYLREHLAT